MGNLSFYTTELQIEEVFKAVGPVKRVIMGLNMKTKTPCGFCFVEYYTVEHTAAALKSLNGVHVDNRIIRCDKDTGFKPGRQYGRGISGGQVRDEQRQVHDAYRGGLIAKSSGIKRGREGRSQARGSSSRGSDAAKDEFGRDIENREAQIAESMHKMDQGLSSSRAAPKAQPRDDVENDAPAELEVEVEVEDVDTADPRSMHDERDAEEQANPSKRQRR